MFRKPNKRESSNLRQHLDESGSSSSSAGTSKKPNLVLDDSGTSTDEKSEKADKRSKESDSSSSSMPDETYKPEREWLEPMVNEKGETLHFAGLLPNRWAPEYADIYEDEEINRAVQLINSWKSSGNKPTVLKCLNQLSRCAPRRLDVLHYCVEVSEECRDNEMVERYLRCILELNPLDESAKRDRLKILRSVDEEDNELFSRLDKLLEQCKSRPSDPDDLKRQKLFRERLIYNTVAIEGNTLNLREVSEVLNTNARIEEHSDREHLEVKGTDEALKFIEERQKQGLLSANTLTLEDILEMHRRVLLDRPTLAGEFRGIDVCIGGVPFMPLGPECVEQEMNKVIKFINNKPEKMHPVEFAALVHYAFVYVHPFADGNGRVSRMLMNIALNDHGFPDLIVPCIDKWNYCDALYFGQMGSLRQFIRYIGNLMEKRLEAYFIKGNYSLVDTDEPPHTVVID